MTHNAPVLILALPRTYSSIICAMLGQHPGMYGLLETQVFEVDTMREWWDRYGDRNHDSDGLLRTTAEIVFGHQCETTIEQAFALLEEFRTCSTADVIFALLEHIHPLKAVLKNPFDGAWDDDIQGKLNRRLAMFPEGMFLHLVRHPIGFGTSHLEHLEKMSRAGNAERLRRRYSCMIDPTVSPPVVDPQTLWYRVNAGIDAFLTWVPARQKLRVCGENLLADPDSELRRIVRWLGLRDDPEAIEEMKHPERSPFACLGPENAMFGGDPKFFSDPVLRPSRAKTFTLDEPLPWREGRAGFKPEVAALARSWGYS